jgi:dihydrofolate synthase/folylpolyglutamate synthase
MRYRDAIHFIYNLELFGIKMGLDNITRMLQHLDNPQDTFRAIHIAGTNGKGSVASMLFSILKAAGYRVGVFTSPHLVDIRERFRTHAGHIDKRSLARFIGNNQQFIIDARITFFEISTALAFWYFRKVGVDVAVVEVGLGGRLDATNVLQPELTIINDIDYDHTKILGNSLEKIAWEKAGIIKPGVPLLIGVRRRRVMNVLRAIAHERGSPLRQSRKPATDFTFRNGLMRFQVGMNGTRRALSSSLIGVHQIHNATVATEAVEILCRRGFRIPQSAVRTGLRNCRWPGRFQLVSSGPTILLDVAHNPAGATALVRSFRSVFPGRQAIMVCGFLERPDYDQMLTSLAGITRRAVLTRPDYRRAAEIGGVIWAAVNADIDFDVRLPVADAVDRALQLLRGDEVLLICGSHFTVGEAIVRLQNLGRKGRIGGVTADITYIDDGV